MEKILFYDGKPLQDQEGKQLSVRDIVVNAINYVHPEETPEPGEKSRIFEISLKMFQSDEEVELGIEEIAFILEKAEKALIPVTYGRLKEILET